MKRLALALAVGTFALGVPATVDGAVGVGPGGGTPGTEHDFQLVGHSGLFDRGLNAAPAIFGDFLYVGNRTDGSSTCGPGDPRGEGTQNCPHPHPGILILSIKDPSHPQVVGEIPPPLNAAGQPTGVTSRELRVWPEKKLLVVMTFRCSFTLHACQPPDSSPGAPPPDVQFPFAFKFYDLSDPVHPRLISTHVPRSAAGVAVKPHEMYLWVDPKNPNRALLWESTPSVSAEPTHPNLLIEDISDVPNGGPVRLVAQGNWNQFFPAAANPAEYDFDLSLHSMAPTADGRRTNLAYLRGGFGILDTSEVVDRTRPGAVISLNDKLLTPVRNFVRWGAGNHCAGGTPVGCSESHSAVPVPGRPFELSTDEVYGKFTAPSFGWPWAWSRLISVSDPRHPKLVGQYKIFQQTEAFLPKVDPATENFTSYGSHNPTVLPDLAFIDWHSGGLQAIDITDPAHPAQAGWFSPLPLQHVANEDPALSRGPNKVVLWSYPIIKNGLIYVVDVRNGLYILRYTGPHASEAAEIRFLEGNSNLDDAVRLALGGAR